MPTWPEPAEAAEPLALLASRAADEPLAARELIARTQVPVRRFAVSMVGPSAADDVVQDTFIRAWASLHRYGGDREFLPWLLGVARHVALDHLRRERRQQAVAERLGRQPSQPELLPNDEVAELVRTLEPKRRLAFVLTQVLGYDYAEAARIAGCAIGTLRSRVHRARTELLEAWQA